MNSNFSAPGLYLRFSRLPSGVKLLLTAAIALIVGLTQHALAFNIELTHSQLPLWLISGMTCGLCFLLGRKSVSGIFLGFILAAIVCQNQEFTELAYEIFLYFCVVVQSLALYLGFRQFSLNQINPLHSSRNLLTFVGLGLVVSALGALIISVGHSVLIRQSGLDSEVLFLTFLANYSGLLTLAPVLMSLRSEDSRKTIGDATPFEKVLLLLVFCLLLFMAYGLQLSILLYLTPALLWTAARFHQTACTITILVSNLLLLPELNTTNIHTQQGLIPHFLELSWLIIATATLYFCTLLNDQKRIENQLEDLVLRRTLDLNLANQELRDEVFVRKQAEKSFRNSSRRYRMLFETAAIPIIVLDTNFRIKQWNSATETLLGCRREDLNNKNFVDLFIPRSNQDEVAWRFTRLMETGIAKESFETEVVSFDGLHHTMLWNMNYLVDTDEENAQAQLLLIGQNISEIRKTQDQLHYLAHFDVLTGTANRRLFEDRCRQAILSAIRHRHQVALLGLDIDHFKRINDSLGHDAGDEFLITLSNRLKGCVRSEDTIARLGGDEFAVLLVNINGQDGAETAARNILDTITRPITINGSELIVTSSIGITLCPNDGTDFTDLLKNADMAMYRAKKAGRNNIQFYSPEMNDEMQRQLRIEQELTIALQKNQFKVYYQPIIDIDTGEVVALEALLRWMHPSKGLVLPDYFLSVAEQTGQVHDIGAWMLLNVCLHGRLIREWTDTPLQIALNLSTRQFNHPTLVQHIQQVLRETHYNPHDLILDISEQTLNQNPDSGHDKLYDLKNLGVSLTIDGFGSGLSSLRQLRQLPIDMVKIDRTFVDGIPDDENDIAICETLLAIASQMDLRTFATGVETKEQEAFMKINGCRYVQGYRYAEPLSVWALQSFLKDVKEGVLLGGGDQIFLPFQA